MKEASFQVANVSLEADLIVLFGTWAEFILPVFIVIGLFGRLSSLGMIIFIGVMTYVDVSAGNLNAETWGALFDGQEKGEWDRRALWVFLLLVIVIKGPGPLSVDKLLDVLMRKRRERPVMMAAEQSPIPEPSPTPEPSLAPGA